MKSRKKRKKTQKTAKNPAPKVTEKLLTASLGDLAGYANCKATMHADSEARYFDAMNLGKELRKIKMKAVLRKRLVNYCYTLSDYGFRLGYLEAIRDINSRQGRL